MEVPAIIAIIGGIAFLVGLLGGGIKAVQIEIPQLPRWLRFLSSLTGVVLIGIAIWLSFLVSGVPTVQPTATGPSIATASATAPQPTVLPTATVPSQGQAAPPAPTVSQFCAFVTRSQIDELEKIQDVAAAIRKAEELAGYRQNDYEEGETIPAGVLIAIDLRSSDLEQFGVTPINNQGGWGLFETTRKFQAPNDGTYWCIQEPSSSTAPSFYFEESVAHHNMGNYNNAISLAQACIELYPTYSDCYNRLGITYREIGDFINSLSHHDRAIELAPTRYDFYWERGVTYQRMTEYESAISDFETCIERNPAFGDCYNGLGMVYRDIGDFTQALSYHHQAIELDGSRGDFFWERGVTYQRMGENATAEDDFSKARELGHGQ
jgi:tetratricopeptide (TPR) repeat protein